MDKNKIFIYNFIIGILLCIVNKDLYFIFAMLFCIYFCFKNNFIKTIVLIYGILLLSYNVYINNYINKAINTYNISYINEYINEYIIRYNNGSINNIINNNDSDGLIEPKGLNEHNGPNGHLVNTFNISETGTWIFTAKNYTYINDTLCAYLITNTLVRPNNSNAYSFFTKNDCICNVSKIIESNRIIENTLGRFTTICHKPINYALYRPINILTFNHTFVYNRLYVFVRYGNYMHEIYYEFIDNDHYASLYNNKLFIHQNYIYFAKNNE